MTDLLIHLLGTDAADPGCDAAFEALDQLAETILEGRDPGQAFASILTHAAQCTACREDTEGYLTALREIALPEAPRAEGSR